MDVPFTKTQTETLSDDFQRGKEALKQVDLHLFYRCVFCFFTYITIPDVIYFRYIYVIRNSLSQRLVRHPSSPSSRMILGNRCSIIRSRNAYRKPVFIIVLMIPLWTLPSECPNNLLRLGPILYNPCTYAPICQVFYCHQIS